MAKKSGDSEAMRLSILQAATGLFAQNGIGAASLSDIAAAAHMSKGTLYYYYPSKELLVLDIARAHLNRTTDQIYGWLETLDRDGYEEESLLSLLEYLLSDTEAMRLNVVLKTEAALGLTGLNELFEHAYREWTLMLEVGALKMPPGAAKRMDGLARLFFALLDGLMLHELLGLDPSERIRLVNLLLGVSG